MLASVATGARAASAHSTDSGRGRAHISREDVPEKCCEPHDARNGDYDKAERRDSPKRAIEPAVSNPRSFFAAALPRTHRPDVGPTLSRRKASAAELTIRV